MYENRVPAQSPVFGLRVVNRDCLTPQGFSAKRLDAVYADLASSAHGHDMLMEAASFDEVDSYYNPGEEEVSPDFILEAIVVERFSQTERRMAAVVRVFNRFLSGSEIKALLPVVGKPRKTGAYAYVTVQLPFTDGQTVSVVFHSPEGDKKKIAPNDTIIAFQWLLNRRDITHVVAPENGSEISLDELAKKITQLVVKNSVRFERTQKDAAEERKLLDDTRKAVDDAEDRQNELMAAIASASSESETVDAKLSNTLSLLEKQKSINAELQAKLDALEKAQANGGGGSSGNSDNLFDRMVDEAAKWRGAVMKAAKLVSHDKKKALALMKITTKGDLDAYLMSKFGVDASTARDVSNELTRKNIPDDMTAELSEYASEPWAQMVLAQSSTPEEHYSDKVLSALVEMFGWTKSGEAFVQKDVGGGETGGALNPTGNRIVSANFDAERRRWISLYSGFDKVLSVDGRPALSGKREDVMAVAREFDAQVMEWARKTTQGSPADNGESSLILELPITTFRPEEMRVMSESGAYLVQTRRDSGEWITQKVHATEDAAIQDAQTWYQDPHQQDAFGPSFTEVSGKPAEAVDLLLLKKTGHVPGAVLRPDIGPIDIPWGKTGDDGFGLAHIIERRNMQGLDGEAFVRRLPQILERGKLRKKVGVTDRVYIVGEENDAEAVVRLNWDGKERTWLVSGYSYTKKPPETPTGLRTSSQTHGDEQLLPSSRSEGDVPLIEHDNQSVNQPSFVNTLQDILAGQYDSDTGRMGSLLDEAAEEAEKAGTMEQYEDLFNQAADHLTAMLKKRAA